MSIKIDISKKLIFEILILIVLIIVFVYILLTSSGNQINSSLGYDRPLEIKNIAGCDKGIKISDKSNNGKFTYSLECLGEMSDDWDNFSRDKMKTILLNNSNVLIYNSTQAILFDPVSKTFKTLVDKNSSSFEWKPELDREFIKYNKNQYLIYPDILFNEQNNTFSKWNNSKYNSFYKSGKYYLSNTKCLGTIDHKYYLFVSLDKMNDKIETIVWSEDPLNLTRSKYGKLNTLLDLKRFETWLYPNFNEVKGIKLNDERILVFINNNLEIFNPKTGEVTFKTKLNFEQKSGEGSEIKAVVLQNGTVFITKFMYGKETSDFELYDPKTKTLDVITGYSNEGFSPYYYRGDSLNELLLLSDGKVLLYGSISGIFDPHNKKFFRIRQLLVNRNYSTLTQLKDGQVLIINGHLNKHSQNKIFIYNSAELFSYKVNN